MKKIYSLLLMFALLLVGCNEQREQHYTLPDLAGMTQEEVDDKLEAAPVTVVYQSVEQIGKPEGVFLEYGKELEVNDQVKYGSVIYVYFTKAISTPTANPKVILPNLNGKALNEIVAIMNDLNLSIKFNYMESNTVEDNLFISYGNELVAGNEVSELTEVTINISQFISKNVKLPDLTRKNRQEIELLFHPLNINLTFTELKDVSYDTDEFIRYASYNIGDPIEEGVTIEIIIANNRTESDYFTPITIDYDGPRLDSKYANIDPINPRGGYFKVPLTRCIDGDTAKFDYPDYIDVELSYPGESVRFLNMDTEETFPGGEEEWGKPGSVYTCNQLESAESIIIQTDPDDNLTGNHGRLLSWIWIVPEGTSIKNGENDYTLDQYELLNYKIVQQGLARVAYLYGAGQITYSSKSYTDWMFQAQNYAKNEDLGQWSDLLDPYWDYDKDQPLF